MGVNDQLRDAIILFPEKELTIPTRMGRLQSWSGCGSEEKNPCPY
jgi:hypothetical protein